MNTEEVKRILADKLREMEGSDDDMEHAKTDNKSEAGSAEELGPRLVEDDAELEHAHNRTIEEQDAELEQEYRQEELNELERALNRAIREEDPEDVEDHLEFNYDWLNEMNRIRDLLADPSKDWSRIMEAFEDAQDRAVEFEVERTDRYMLAEETLIRLREEYNYEKNADERLWARFLWQSDWNVRVLRELDITEEYEAWRPLLREVERLGAR